MAEPGRFLDKFIAENPVTDTTLEHFKSIPWIKKYVEDEAYEPIPTWSRSLKPSGEDYFFSRTLNSPVTIPHYLTLRVRNLTTPPPTEPAQSGSAIVIDHTQKTVVPDKPDAIFFISIGPRGIDGHPGVAHGGMSCALLDETMGLMVMLHHTNIRQPGPRDLLFTINLNVSYRKQVSTPNDLMIKTWLVKREDRKWYTKGQIMDKDGNVLSEGSALWLLKKSKL